MNYPPGVNGREDHFYPPEDEPRMLYCPSCELEFEVDVNGDEDCPVCHCLMEPL